MEHRPEAESVQDGDEYAVLNGYAGPVNEAAGTVYNDFVLVDMFARVVTGESSPDNSVRAATRAAQRYYK